MKGPKSSKQNRLTFKKGLSPNMKDGDGPKSNVENYSKIEKGLSP